MTAPAAVAVECVDLAVDDPYWATALPVLQELRPHLSPALLRRVLAGPMPPTFTALFTSAGACVGVAGWRVVTTAAHPSGRRLHVDDLVTAGAHRGQGYGARLLEELERRAQAAGAGVLELDSGTKRTAAHRFYLHRRMEITCLHLAMQVGRREDL